MSEEELDDLFDDIRQTCSKCSHPRCISIVKSAKSVITDLGNSRELEGRMDESKNIGQDISGVYYEYEDGSRFTLEERRQQLESQKEKTQ